MFSNAVQLASHSLGTLAATGNALMRRPQVIINAILTIASIAKFYPLIAKYYPKSNLNSSLCEKLNDTEWESLPLRSDFNDFKQKVLFSDLKCEAATAKLLSELMKDFRKVASDMGHADPSVFSLELLDRETRYIGIRMDNVLFISPNYAEKWWNLESSQQRKRIRGIFAHETAHKMLKHEEKVVKKALETLGIAVKSLDDVSLVSGAINKQINEASFLRQVAYSKFGIPLLKSDYFNSSSNESTKQLYADITSLIQSNSSALQEAFGSKVNKTWMINNEIEADLLTLRVPEYARGSRDFLEDDLLECEKVHNSTFCNSFDPIHPPLRHRVAYLTDPLCEKYPGQNQDICQCSATEQQG